MIAFYDGCFLDETELKISPFCSGFMYGKGIFSTLKFTDGRIEFLEDHLLRIKSGLNFFQMKFPDYQIREIIANLVIRNGMAKARVKIILFENNIEQTSIIVKLEKIGRQPKYVSLKTDENFRGNSDIYRYKTLNYYNNILSVKKARKENFDYSLFVSNDGYVLETSFHNIFFIKQNKIYTPLEQQNILPGIIRKKILEKNEFKVIRKEILFDEISDFEAVFITNSISIALPVFRIDRMEFDLDKGIKFSEKIKKLISKN